MERIRVAGPWISSKEIEYVTDAVSTGWYGQATFYTDRFEKKFAEYLGMEYAMALPSCTSGLHLSLLALGVGAGDEVVVPEATWIATAAPVTYVGAKLVFADVDPETWCLSVPSLLDWITPRTRAVIPVDLYGNLPDMIALREVCAERGIAIIEDAAEAIGSELDGQKAGTFGDAGAFSFHGSKTLTTGEGGMLVTNRADVYQRAQILSDHGRLPGDRMSDQEVGYKYKMSNLQGALGLAQLERIDELVARKREIFDWYAARLQGVDGITLNAEGPRRKNTYWMITVILDAKLGLEKERVINLLAEQTIDCRPVFYPLSALPAFSDHPDLGACRDRNLVSYRLSRYGVNLPSGFDMTEEKVDHVCAALLRILKAS